MVDSKENYLWDLGCESVTHCCFFLGSEQPWKGYITFSSDLNCDHTFFKKVVLVKSSFLFLSFNTNEIKFANEAFKRGLLDEYYTLTHHTIHSNVFFNQKFQQFWDK